MEQSHKEMNNTRLQEQMSLLVTILLVLAVALCLFTVVQVLSQGYVNIGGFMLFRVVTGSMEPTIPVGALMVTREVDITTISLNDIVCFRTQVSEIWGKIVTHRVVGIYQSELGSILLETKGDANLVADGFFVDERAFVGKVVWHTGDGSILANIIALFTNKIGFLGCIVLPALLLAAMILKDSVSGIRQELQLVLEMEQQQSKKQSWEDDPLCGMTQEEYNEMYERIRAEIMEELKHLVEEQNWQIVSAEKASEADQKNC